MSAPSRAFLPMSTARSIVVAQAIYAFGALLSAFSAYCTIGFIVLIRLNYVLAPRIGRFFLP